MSRSARRPRQTPTRGAWITRAGAVAVALLCAVSIGVGRASLVESHRRAVKAMEGRAEVAALPTPAGLRLLSMGYRSALADYLWADVLVTQGLRLATRRPYPEVWEYLQGITDLDPKFREPYRLADTLLLFQVGDKDPMRSSARARELMRRGLDEFAYDAEMWVNYGQFLAYLAPGIVRNAFDSMADDTEREQAKAQLERWRKEGISALVTAGELGGADESIASRTMYAASLLHELGQADAAVRFLERLYAATDNEEARAHIAESLEVMREGRSASRDFVIAQAFQELWKHELPFGSATSLSILGPRYPVWACAGRAADREGQPCYRTWTDWARAVEQGKTRTMRKPERP